MSVFTTWTGATLEFDKLEKYSPDIRDVAHSLSLLCRYRGQIDYLYSVAQHSLFVEEILATEGCSLYCRLSGLLHDAPESIISDCPSPLKQLLPEFMAFEKRIGDLFDWHFHVQSDLSEVIAADKAALLAESYCLVPTEAMPIADIHYLVYNLPPKYSGLFRGVEDPDVTEQKFLAKYWELKYLIEKDFQP